MKAFFFLIIGLIAGSVFGLITRPSFFLIGQLNWLNVLSKGHFVGPIEGFFSQGMIDESFFYVLKFQAIGVGSAFILIMLFNAFTKKGKSKGKEKKKK